MAVPVSSAPILAGRSDGLRAVVRPPMPIVGKLKSLIMPDFESIGLKTPPNVKVCELLVQVRSSRIVGTRINRSCELMRAKGAARPKAFVPKTKEFGDDGANLTGNSAPERAAPTVALFTTDVLGVQVWPTIHT